MGSSTVVHSEALLMKPLYVNHCIDNNHNNRKQIAEHTAVVIQGRAQRAAERSAEKKKAYDDWSQQKQLLEAARSALQHIDPPAVAAVTSGDGHSNAFQASTGGSAGSGRQEAAARELWIEYNVAIVVIGVLVQQYADVIVVLISAQQYDVVAAAVLVPLAVQSQHSVGRALKAVDTRLLKEWTDWGNSIANTSSITSSSSIIGNTMSGSTAIVSATAAAAATATAAAAASSSGVKYSATQCQAVWDFLPPMACDTHAFTVCTSLTSTVQQCASAQAENSGICRLSDESVSSSTLTHTGYSALRETFLKLLRPSADYKAAFQKVLQRRQQALRRKENSQVVQRPIDCPVIARTVSYDYDDRRHDGSDAGDDQEDAALTKKELKYLLTRELGIVMGAEEMRRLVDAFDANKDQRVSWREFEEFTGGTRDAVRGDSSKRLGQRCTWETTCPTTGMPNAYVVSAVTRKPLTSATPDSNNDDSSSPQNNNSGTMQWGGGTTSVYTLANGEQRRRTELPDRCKRLDILARHGLISSATSPHKSKRGAAGAGAGGAYADDAFEGSDNDNQHDDDDYGSDEFEGRSPSPQKRNSSKQNNSHEGGDEGAGAAGKFQQCAAVGWSMVKRQCFSVIAALAVAAMHVCRAWVVAAPEVVPTLPIVVASDANSMLTLSCTRNTRTNLLTTAQEGLRTLKRLAKPNREAAELRKILEEGSPPPAPKFWSAQHSSADVGTSEDALLRELLLCWRAQPLPLCEYSQHVNTVMLYVHIRRGCSDVYIRTDAVQSMITAGSVIATVSRKSLRKDSSIDTCILRVHILLVSVASGARTTTHTSNSNQQQRYSQHQWL
eukprot:18084-Heterococcus_DN1.PRE.2